MIDKKISRILLSIGFVFFVSFNLMAQGPGPINPASIPPPYQNPVPISGIEILLGAGALLGAKRMLKNRQAKV